MEKKIVQFTKPNTEEIKTDQTPIEIMLEVDENGETTARKLYDFLQLAPQHFARWSKTNITENKFAIENEDFRRVTIEGETPTGGKVMRDDFKLTASFAKKLCMTSQSNRGEEARNYFVKVEDVLRNKNKQEQLINHNGNMFLAQQIQTMANIVGQYMENNALQMLQMKEQTKSEVKEIVRDSIVIKDQQIERMSELVGLRDRNTKMLSNTLKDKLSSALGKNVKATDGIYKKTRDKIFKEYKVCKWEEISINKCNSVFAFIDEMDISV